MTRQDKKRLLMRYPQIDNATLCAIDDYNIVFAKATKITQSFGDGSHSSGNTSKVEKYADILLQKSKKIERLKGDKLLVEKEVRLLKPHQRMMIKAIYFDGIPIERYAKMCKRPVETVRHSLNRVIDSMFE